MRRGERLVWCGPNSLEVIATIHAARKAGLGRGAALVPVQRRRDAVRHRQLRRDARGRRRRAGAAPRRRSATACRRSGHVVVVRRRRARRVACAWDDVLARRAGRRAGADADATRRLGAADALHVGHHRASPKGALRTTTDPGIVLALLGELGLQPGDEVHITTGPLYHSGPLAFASLAPHAGQRRSSCCASSTRARGCAS